MRLLPATVARILPVRHVRKLVQKPVGWLDDGCGYQDVQTVLTDPWPSGPYPHKDMGRIFSENQQPGGKTKNEKKSKITNNTDKLDFSHIPLEQQSVFLFPGQGAQFVGMGKQLLDCDAAKHMFDAANHILGYDLLKLCLEGPKESLDRTIHCQPAVFVASLAAAEKLKQERPEVIKNAVSTAGFSVGEYAALVFANSLSFDQALRLVQVRAEAMQRCSENIPSGMVSVRITAKSQLSEAITHAKRVASESMADGNVPVCGVANYLYSGMQVIGGDEAVLKVLEEIAKEYDVEVVKRLPVSGAFHTQRMRNAVEPMAAALESADLQLPTIDVYSNVTGQIYERNISKMKRRLLDQIHQPVKWEQIQQLLLRKHVDSQFPRYFELGPGKQLGTMFYYVSKKAYKALTNVPV
uniref:Malonyl-CoA:ACP transacylase (MAT) domain-containing protein n=1 Tax=Plectus sambesii TaxID=2011161 RepID=A0A914UV70_9BILA